jgi:hypothetical protein
LAELKRLQQREGKSFGRLASDLLAQALASSKRSAVPQPQFQWITTNGSPRVDLADREAVYDALDGFPT